MAFPPGNKTAPPFGEKGPAKPPPFKAKGKPSGGKSDGGNAGGKFPIEDEASLKKAIRLAKTPAGSSARAYVKRRAAALGLSKLIPSDW